MRKTMRLWMGLALLCELAVTAGCQQNYLSEEAKQRNRALEEILKREDRREFGEAAYWQALLDRQQDPQIWDRAILAMGRIGDPRALRVLAPYARRSATADAQRPSSSARIREGVAFTLGEIEDRATREALGRPADPQTLDLLLQIVQDPAETAWRVRACAAEALGKIGDPRAVPAVLHLTTNPPPELGPAAAQVITGLGLVALFRLEDHRVIIPVLALAPHADPEIRWQAANCVYRLLQKAPGTSADAVKAAMLPRLNDASAMVRGYAARALSVTNDPAVADHLKALLDDPAFFVQVEAANALGRLKNPATAKWLTDRLGRWLAAANNDPRALKSKTLNLAVAMAQALGMIGEPLWDHREVRRLLEPLRMRTNPRLEPVYNAGEIAAAKIFKGRDDFFGRSMQHVIEMRAYWGRFTTTDGLRAAVTAVGEHQSEAAIRVLRDLMEQEPNSEAVRSGIYDWERIEKVRPTILESMVKLNPPDLEAILRRHLSHPDEITRRVAAEKIGELKDKGAVSADVVPALIAAYNRSGSTAESRRAIITTVSKFGDSPDATRTITQALKDPHQLVRARAIQYLARTTGQDYTAALGTSETHVEDTVYMLAAADRHNVTRATMETTRGTIEMELFPEDAPLTVHNFKQLAEKGFYNQLDFMRVVPNFVVQAGSPRNDMEGGPGYTIRCEINQRPFLRGSVGMALDGKDTGGSQFFICLSPQPHLDGGYTVFGRVLTGMEIVENLIPGDKILNVRIRAWPSHAEAP